MPSSDEGRALHALAEEARERGEFLEALEFTDQATLAYQKDGDMFGLAEVQSSRQSTFKHLYRSTGDGVFLVLEKHAAEVAVELAEKCGIPEAMGIPYHNLGKYYSEVKEYQKATEFFKKAVANLKKYPKNSHSRASVIADITGHQYAAEYHVGDKTALERALESLKQLDKSVDAGSSYNKNAWVSGAHIRIAEMLQSDNSVLARKHFEEAKKIIDSDPRQILRKKQLLKLQKTLK